TGPACANRRPSSVATRQSFFAPLPAKALGSLSELPRVSACRVRAIHLPASANPIYGASLRLYDPPHLWPQSTRTAAARWRRRRRRGGESRTCFRTDQLARPGASRLLLHASLSQGRRRDRSLVAPVEEDARRSLAATIASRKAARACRPEICVLS